MDLVAIPQQGVVVPDGKGMSEPTPMRVLRDLGRAAGQDPPR